MAHSEGREGMRPPDPATAGPLMGNTDAGDQGTPPPAQRAADPLTQSRTQHMTPEQPGVNNGSPDPLTQPPVEYSQDAMDVSGAGDATPTTYKVETNRAELTSEPPGPPAALVARALENAIDREIADGANESIQTLRGELGAKFVGWSAYYQEKEVELRRDRAVAVSQDAFNKALAVVTLALDCGPVKDTNAGATMLLLHQWFRVALITVAAAVRGALRSDDIVRAAGHDLDPRDDILEVHRDLGCPHTEGEALQAMLEHLSGLLRGWRGLPGDANPETFLDYIKTKSRAELEALAEKEAEAEVGEHKASHLQRLKELAEPELRAEAQAWVDGLQAVFEAHYFDRFFEKIRSDVASASWAGQVRAVAVADLHTVFTGRRAEIEREAEEQVREEARKAAEAQVETWKQEHYNALKNLAIKGVELEAKQAYKPNIARWQEEKLEELKREAPCQAETEARNAKIARIERREKEWEDEIDGLVKSRNPHLILKAARDLGFNITEGGKGRSDGPEAQPPKAARGNKRTVSGQSVSVARGRSPSHTPTQTPRAKAASLCDIGRAPPVAPTEPPANTELAEILSRVSSPAPGMQGAADSMHAPRALLEPTAFPATLSEGDLRSTGSSVHCPANAMDEDAVETMIATAGSEEPHPQLPARSDPYVDAAGLADAMGLDPKNRALLLLVDRLLSKVTDRLDRVEARQEQPNPRGSKQDPQAGPPPRPAPVAHPDARPRAPPRQPSPPTSAQPPPADDNGYIPTRTWAKVAAPRTGLIITDKAIASHAAATALLSAAAQAQNRTPAGRMKAGGHPTPARPLTTEVVVIRNGGFEDSRREEKLRGRSPRDIVMEVRTEVERQCRNPIKVLSGRWLTTYQKTGNFVYTLAGDVSIPAMVSYKKWLCGPFPDAQIPPTAGWVWAHLRGVPTRDEDRVLYTGEELLKEVQSNEMFAEAMYTATPKWQIPPEKMMSETATVLVAYVDPTGEISKHALADGVFMFGAQIKFVVAGDKPALIQCRRCHLLGHNKTRASARHNFECKGPHKVAGKCDCALKCILCGKSRHNARSRACPKRGDFAPPRLARAQDTPTDRQPAPGPPPAPQTRAKGKQREEPPHQRVDDDNILYSPSAVQDPLPLPTEDTLQAGPSGRITAIVPARRVQPDQAMGGYGTRLIAEDEAETLRRKAEAGNALVAAAMETPPNPPNA
ncbi:hypothetical protein EDB85DRAFT_2160630 [Lactarius pseudohatsudake]|nr:hypothetical protein EDB85DRAFT_2160630 [Lactarius pseudohatsudake]